MKKGKMKRSKKEKNLVRIWIENIVEVLIVVVCIVFSIIMISSPGGIKDDIHKTNVSYMPVLSNSMSGTFEKGDIIFSDKYKYDAMEKNILEIDEVITFVAIDKASKTYYINTHRIVAYSVTYKSNDKTYIGYKQFLEDTEGKVKNKEDAYLYAEKLGYDDFAISGYITSGDNKSIYYVDGDVNGQLINQNNTYLVDEETVAFGDVIGIWNGKKIAKLGGAITWLQKPLNFFLVILIPLILLFVYNIWIIVKYIIEVKTEKARKLALEEANANSNGSISAEEEEEIKRKAVEEYMKKMGIDPSSLPKKEDSSNDVKEEKVDVVEPTSEDKVVDDKKEDK